MMNRMWVKRRAEKKVAPRNQRYADTHEKTGKAFSFVIKTKLYAYYCVFLDTLFLHCYMTMYSSRKMTATALKISHGDFSPQMVFHSFLVSCVSRRRVTLIWLSWSSGISVDSPTKTSLQNNLKEMLSFDRNRGRRGESRTWCIRLTVHLSWTGNFLEQKVKKRFVLKLQSKKRVDWSFDVVSTRNESDSERNERRISIQERSIIPFLPDFILMDVANDYNTHRFSLRFLSLQMFLFFSFVTVLLEGIPWTNKQCILRITWSSLLWTGTQKEAVDEMYCFLQRNSRSVVAPGVWSQRLFVFPRRRLLQS